jgi:surface protein
MYTIAQKKLNKLFHRERGVTIVELFIALLIVSLLTTITFPYFHEQTIKAEKAKIQADVKSTNISIMSHLVNNPDATFEELKLQAVVSTGNTLTITGEGYSYSICAGSPKAPDYTFGFSTTTGQYSENCVNNEEIKPTMRIILISGSEGWNVINSGNTITCEGVSNGESADFTIDGTATVITKRTTQQIRSDNSLASTSCTSGITEMNNMFSSNHSVNNFNEDISHWDTSNVKNMNKMFNNALLFNHNISLWNTGNVTNMQHMFAGANAFNQPIGNWDTGNVTNMMSMFYSAAAFNQDLSGWCVANISSQPVNFNVGAIAWFEQQPLWGTCPQP